MAIKLTYRDGQEDDYDDGTQWAVEGGVLKMGRESGKWTVLVSPSHWATIEVRDAEDKEDREDEEDIEDKKKGKGEKSDVGDGKGKDKGES